ncbi:MAG TPA: FAD binding domain-containing protein [Pseudonocardia sp.]|jgi:carbon-monoxide dehydrogenase medium subunit|nr:FAD binding domain-containing protein [Pseudonocardia sp.]
MRPPPFEYREPGSVHEVCAVLAEYGERAAVLAGGQSLIADLNARRVRPDVVVSIGRTPGLDSVETTDNWLRIGAAVTQRVAAAAPGAPPVLVEALEQVGHVPTRNRGTVGGSIAFADPAAELAAVLLGLGGSVLLRSVSGEREVAAEEWFTGPFRTARRPDELLVEVRLPIRAGVWAFEQRDFRRHAKVSVVAGLAPDGTLRVAASGVADTPVLLPEVGEPVVGADRATEVAQALGALVQPSADLYGGLAYRHRMVELAATAALRRVLVARTVTPATVGSR